MCCGMWLEWYAKLGNVRDVLKLRSEDVILRQRVNNGNG